MVQGVTARLSLRARRFISPLNFFRSHQPRQDNKIIGCLKTLILSFPWRRKSTLYFWELSKHELAPHPRPARAGAAGEPVVAAGHHHQLRHPGGGAHPEFTKIFTSSHSSTCMKSSRRRRRAGRRLPSSRASWRATSAPSGWACSSPASWERRISSACKAR